MPSTPPHLVVSSVFNAHSIRRITAALLSLGLGQLALWLYYCLWNFYGGARVLLLPVHAGLKFGMAHPQIGQMLASPAGYFSTSSQGELLYHPTSLGEYFLFFTIGNLTIVDALFLAGLVFFLFRALRQLPTSREYLLAVSRIMDGSGLALSSMFVLKMMFSICVIEVFKAKNSGLVSVGIPCQ